MRPFVLTVLIVAPWAGCLAPAAPLDGSEDAADPASPWDLRGNFSRVREQGPFGVLPVERLDFPSFDQTMLAAAVWRPAVAEGTRVPVIVQLSPYWADGLAEEDPWTKDFFLVNFVPWGYAYAKVVLRGTSESSGCMSSMGPDEQRDVDEAVTFLGSRPWSSGAVGAIGVSYVGTTPWVAAASGNPYLKTIVPISGVTSWAETGFRNGTSEPRAPVHTPLYWALGNTGVDGDDPTYRAGRMGEALCPAPAEGALASGWTALTGDRAPPTGPDYWAVRDFRERVLANYRGSVFIVHGLQDWNVDPDQAFPFAEHLRDAGLEVKVLLGQWKHQRPDGLRDQHVRWDWAEMLLRWFDRHLRGIEADTGPAVWVEDNRGAWRVEGSWPPRDAVLPEIHLGEGQLSWSETAPGEAVALHAAGALDERRCGAMAGVNPAGTWFNGTAWDFAMAPQERELRFAGLAQVHVTVVPESPHGGILHAVLWDQTRDGSWTELAHGSMNLRYHDGGTEPRTLVPGEPVLARMELRPADVVLPPAHRLWLRIIPDGDVEACRDVKGHLNDLNKPVLPSPAPMTLQWGEGRSVLRLPIVEREVGEGRYPGQPGV